MRKLRVLFLCVGNACRSQMAEGFARAYGADVLEPQSAGLSPYSHLPEQTREAMLEKGVDVSKQFPKGIDEIDLASIDLIVNLSGTPIPPGRGNVRNWDVPDPFGFAEAVYRQARDEIERRVMELVLETRRARPAAPARGDRNRPSGYDPEGWRRGR
jgi:arsenate reductase